MTAADVPDDVSETERRELNDHVADILFDPGSSYEADCLMCKRAVAIGLFEEWGFDVEELS